jgi:hypothetical protein
MKVREVMTKKASFCGPESPVAVTFYRPACGECDAHTPPPPDQRSMYSRDVQHSAGPFLYPDKHFQRLERRVKGLDA